MLFSVLVGNSCVHPTLFLIGLVFLFFFVNACFVHNTCVSTYM